MSGYFETGSRSLRRSSFSIRKAILLVVFVVIFYISGSFLSRMANPVSVIFYPFLLVNKHASNFYTDLCQFLRFQTSLVKDRDRLIAENNLLHAALSDRQAIENENIDLRSKLGMMPEKKKKTLAEVLSKPNQIPYDEILISSGVTPIEKGDKVMVEDNVILGTVVTENAKIAKVELFSSPGEKIPILIGANNLPSVASGLGGGNFLVTLPRDVDVKEGELVKTSIIGQYTLGTIGKIEKAPSDPFQKIYVKLPVNLYELKWVMIQK